MSTGEAHTTLRDNILPHTFHRGIKDINKIYSIDELAHKDNVMFAATGVTDGDMLKGVRFFSGGASTHSIVMRSKTRTIRFIEAEHHFNFKTDYEF